MVLCVIEIHFYVGPKILKVTKIIQLVVFSADPSFPSGNVSLKEFPSESKRRTFER